MLVAIAFDHWVKPKLAQIAELPTCEALPYVRAELIAGVLLAWFIGFVALKLGTKEWKENQSPIAGTWVWSRTRVHTGLYARVSAIPLLSMSAFFIFGPLILIVWHKLYLLFCSPYLVCHHVAGAHVSADPT